ncbi:chaplin [Streptomyces ziwulingensis]
MKKSAALLTGAVMALGIGTPAFADAETSAVAMDSEGDFSGNVVQAPVSVPVNVCGNTVDIVALLNPALGNKCESD